MVIEDGGILLVNLVICALCLGSMTVSDGFCGWRTSADLEEVLIGTILCIYIIKYNITCICIFTFYSCICIYIYIIWYKFIYIYIRVFPEHQSLFSKNTWNSRDGYCWWSEILQLVDGLSLVIPSLTSRKLTWQWKNNHLNHLKMYIVYEIVIFMCHVSLLESSIGFHNGFLWFQRWYVYVFFSHQLHRYR